MGNAFDPSALVSSAAWAIGVFILGAALFVTYENRLVRYL
jgi:hypothetical protein